MKINTTKKIIGLSGVAGAGKDLFYELLSERIPCFKISLADNLKFEIKNWCLQHYNIDPTQCPRSKKELIREFLVFHGTFKRKLSEGRHWIESLEKTLAENEHKSATRDQYPVVTDIRYDDYLNDEVSWLKKEQDGILVHISRIDLLFKRSPPHHQSIKIGPANDEEKRNDPKLFKKADYRIEWDTLEGSQTYVRKELGGHVDKFVDWLLCKVT